MQDSVYATEEFLAAAGRASPVRVDKKTGEKYFVETLTGRHIDRRVGIPVTVLNNKGKPIHRLVGTFRTLEAAYGFIVSNCPPAHVGPARQALCDYYGQPVGNLKLGPSAEDLKNDPHADDFLVLDGPIPGVLLAADNKPKKQKQKKKKTSSNEIPKAAGKKKQKAAPKPKKVKFEAIKGTKGFSLIRPTAKPDATRAMVALETAIDAVGVRERLRKRGENDLREATLNGITYIWTDSVPAGKKQPRANMWAPTELGITGDFLVRAPKNFKLTWQA